MAEFIFSHTFLLFSGVGNIVQKYNRRHRSAFMRLPMMSFANFAQSFHYIKNYFAVLRGHS